MWEDSQMAVNMKSCSVSLVIKKELLEITLKYNFTTTRFQTRLTSGNTKSTVRRWRNRNSHILFDKQKFGVKFCWITLGLNVAITSEVQDFHTLQHINSSRGLGKALVQNVKCSFGRSTNVHYQTSRLTVGWIHTM